MMRDIARSGVLSGLMCNLFFDFFLVEILASLRDRCTRRFTRPHLARFSGRADGVGLAEAASRFALRGGSKPAYR
jgi:hypothetical protein